MTNQEIINACKGFEFYTNSISKEMNEYIKKNYTLVNTDYADKKGGNWYMVYREDNDAKYGSYMIEPYLKLMRGRTFWEFYGGGVVD